MFKPNFQFEKDKFKEIEKRLDQLEAFSDLLRQEILALRGIPMDPEFNTLALSLDKGSWRHIGSHAYHEGGVTFLDIQLAAGKYRFTVSNEDERAKIQTPNTLNEIMPYKTITKECPYYLALADPGVVRLRGASIYAKVDICKLKEKK